MTSLLAIALCALGTVVLGTPARACIRCGQPYCQMCRTRTDKAKEYCTQCLHLFVRGDGLAAETKMRKLYEVERHAKVSRVGARLASLVLPGSGQVLRGRAGLGCLLVLLWVVALGTGWPRALTPFERALGMDLRLDLLRAGSLPAAFSLDGAAVVGLLAAGLVWLAANAGRQRAREA